MNLQTLIRQLYYEPSLITPAAAASIRQLIESRLGQADLEARAPGRYCGEDIEVEQMQIIDGIAHIPIGGAIGQKLKPFDRGRGAVDVADIADELNQVDADSNVRAILLDFDSPGGMVSGTPELANRMNRVKKPMYAFTGGLMASAAYWLGATADAIFATPTANIGSIGVYLPWYDQTKAFEMEGIKVELIKAGKLKGAGFPGTPLTDDQRAHLQDRVNSIYGMFKGHVRGMRGDVPDSAMQGQTFLAEDAKANNLIDQVVNSKSEALALIG